MIAVGIVAVRGLKQMAQYDPERLRSERTQVVTNGAAAEQVEAVATDVYAERRARMYKLEQALYLLFGVIEALLAIVGALTVMGVVAVAASVLAWEMELRRSEQDTALDEASSSS